MGTEDEKRTATGAGEDPPSPRLAIPPPSHFRRSEPSPRASWNVGTLVRGTIYAPPLAKKEVSTIGPADQAIGPADQAIDEHALDAGWDPIEDLPSSDLVPDEDRSSDRATVPHQLAPRRPVLELVHPDPLDDDSARSLATTRPPPRSLEPLAMVTRPASAPPIALEVPAPRTSLPGEMARSFPVPSVATRSAALYVASHVAVAGAVLLWVWAHPGTPSKVAPRATHLAVETQSALESAPGAGTSYAAPTEGCTLQDLARVIATRAEVAPGLDANVLDAGFAIGLASRPNEATGVRLEPSTLRTAETVHVKSLWPVAHVSVEQPDADDDARVAVKLDGEGSRALGSTETISAWRGGVFATGADGQRQLLWGIPGPPPKTVETVRAIVRPDGSSIVAVRRPGIMWVGVTGSGFIAHVLRAHMTLGTPALAPLSDGGVIVWAERSARPDGGAFSIVGARIEADRKKTTVLEPVPIAEGMSPSLAALPSGELLLAYADGTSGAHRVVARRLGDDLTPRGELLVLSGDAKNAGQPALAADAEGRAIVAYMTVEHGRATVHANALLCR